MAKTTVFTVTGRGEFPFDMLRYDRCFPHGPQDVETMLEGNTGPRTVTLESAAYAPTPDRWASFGWSYQFKRAGRS